MIKEIEGKSKYVRKRVNEMFLRQRNCYTFLKQDKIDHLEKVSVFNLETKNEKDYAPTFAAG